MREPIMAQKVGNRSGFGKSKSAVGQRPAKLGSNENITARLRSLLAYVPLALRIGVIAIIGLIAFVGYRAAASASFFQVRKVETRGAARASVDDIRNLVRRDVSESGVWQADLQQLSHDLERLPWVRTAVVTRVLPDGIRVRITEREPKAVVRTAAGRFIWVDDDAVYLGGMSPTDQMPSFFLRGWNEEDSNAARAENRVRVR